MFFDGLFFFFKEFCKHLLIRPQRPKTTSVCDKRTKMTITDRKFYLPSRLTNGEGSLPIAIMARIGQSRRPLMSNPNSCEIISKFDHRFLRRFFKNFFMSVKCKKPPFTRAMFIDGSKFCEQYLKRVTQETFLSNYLKI